jgi:hypothetical protein
MAQSKDLDGACLIDVARSFSTAEARFGRTRHSLSRQRKGSQLEKKLNLIRTIHPEFDPVLRLRW